MKPCDARQSLLSAALELIWTNSYASVGVDEICTKAGVKKGSFYYYFRSKAELALLAYEAHWETRKPELEAIFHSDDGPWVKLERWARSVAERQKLLFDKHGFVCGCPYTNLGSELGTLDETLRCKARELLERTYQFLYEVMVELHERGEVEDPAHTARGLQSLVIGQVLLSKIHNEPLSLEKLPDYVNRYLRPIVVAK